MGTAQGSPAQTQKVFGILVRVFGFCLLVAVMCTGIALFCVCDLLANATRVDGEVVDLEYGAKGTAAPVVRFTTANGETLQLKSYLSTSPAQKVGDTVKVVYRTTNPRDWQIDDWIHLYFWTFMGLVFTFAWGMALTITKFVGDRRIRGQAKLSD